MMPVTKGLIRTLLSAWDQRLESIQQGLEKSGTVRAEIEFLVQDIRQLDMQVRNYGLADTLPQPLVSDVIDAIARPMAKMADEMSSLRTVLEKSLEDSRRPAPKIPGIGG